MGYLNPQDLCSYSYYRENGPGSGMLSGRGPSKHYQRESRIKTNNYTVFYLLMTNTETTCQQNDQKMTIIQHYSTFKQVFASKPKPICGQDVTKFITQIQK